MSTAAGTASLDPRSQRVIEERRARRLSRLAARERRTLIFSVGAFLATAVVMVDAIPSERSPGLLTTFLLVAVYALAFRLDFEIGTGSAVPPNSSWFRCSSCCRREWFRSPSPQASCSAL